MLRRIVTAQAMGRGAIAEDAAVPATDMGGGARVYEIWRSPQPAGPKQSGEDWELMPPAGGSVFRVAEFPPATEGEAAYMHLTETIDFGIILEGELTLVMDEGETVLKSGDTFVQRAANHGWLNRGKGIVRMAVVLIDGVQ
ncbi:hypothetical protein GCM10011371_03270 [Novosphingobium marinum]|uniref:Quercetin dioxygenase-like cupin family protein n=1 Tax=Novosphingobium marinum TaxID=1514948 RepID=A0A7Y9XT10_9SPHN|nr:cupin domain-containing protein [Novosphingobium marinum]NYH94019.1 quercetin dioxygenase-like cupin family protein [Novosphingobium marinum]GGC18977.1 hypothetical protein GCM10011371_03270 [Novosphingobium marinum]